MDVGMEEIQNIVLAGKRRLVGADEEAEQRVEQRDEAKELGGEKERPSGLINNLISTLISGRGGDDDEEHEDKRSGGLTPEERKEEEKEGGLVDHIISNLVSPITSPREVHKSKAGEFELQLKEEGKSGDTSLKSEEEFGGGEGIISNLISNIFHQDQGGGGEERKVKDVDEGAEQVKSEGGGGLVECLVSSLPTALAEDAAPGTEEASILIHSIVHD